MPRSERFDLVVCSGRAGSTSRGLLGWLLVIVMAGAVHSAEYSWSADRDRADGSPVVAAAEAGPLSVVARDGEVIVRANETPVLQYEAVPTPAKPYVRQLYTPRGVALLRDAPADHLHHHALMFAVGVDGIDFWGETPGCGRQIPSGEIEGVRAESHDGAAETSFRQSLVWRDADGTARLLEQRTITVDRLVDGSPTLVSWQSVLEVPEDREQVQLWGRHYFGLGLRFVSAMDQGGEFRTSTGALGPVVRGQERLTSARWAAYTAEVDGATVTVAVFDASSNARHPNKIFTMQGPFAYLAITHGLWKDPLTLDDGESLRLRYGVAAWDGRVTDETIAATYAMWDRKGASSAGRR